jgi:sugar phosphate isomerase/epimerase
MHGNGEARLSRRSLLKAGGAAAAGLALGGLVSPARPALAAERDFGSLPMGIQSYSLRGMSFEAAVEKIKELGLKHVEFFGGSHFPNDNPEKVKERLEKVKAAGLSISSHGVNGVGKNHDANRKLFEFAKTLGAPNITIDTPSPKDPKKADELKATLDSLDKLVEEYGISVAIHNHGPSHHYDKPEDVLAAVKDHHKKVGACADLGHYIRSGCDPVETLEKLKDRLYGIHLKDFAEPKGNAKGVILGAGVMKVPAVMKWLKDNKFSGALSLEYEENPKNPVPDIEKCLDAAAAGLKG